MIDVLRISGAMTIALFACGIVAAQDNPLYKSSSAGVEEHVGDLLKRMTLEEKIDMIGGYKDFFIRPNERLGIPMITMADGPLGVRNYGEATAFTAQIGVSASWDADLMHAEGVAVGKEARAKGVHIMLAPAVNIYRLPVCGRNFEYLGEDPYLAGRMAAAYVRGLQSQGVVATVKHFAANNQERNRTTTSADMDERTLQEIYLPAFKAAVQEGGAGAVMTSYNLVNGVHSSQNSHLIRDILKGEWKFDGIVMSDWGSTWDGVAAANAGLDLEMPSGAFMNRETLLPAIKEGKVKETTIDDKVRRMLRVMFRMGFFDRPQKDPNLPRYSPESRLVALRAAREGSVLLKNSGHVLPLDRSRIRSVIVLGPNAYPAVPGGGGSSQVKPFRSVSVIDGMIEVAGESVKVYYAQGFVQNLDRLVKEARYTSGTQPGLRGDYYTNMDLDGTPAMTRTDSGIDFVWNDGPAAGFQKTKYSVRWTGSIHPAADGPYDFVVRGDDGFRLYLDDKIIINAWRDQASTAEVARRMLKAGEHRVRLEYYQNEGGADISLGWGPAGLELDTSAIARAAKSDAAVVCAGFNAATEGEGADRSFSLPSDQVELINAVAKVNPRTIVVLMAGGNVSTPGWLENVPCLLHAWYPGQEGGTAIAEIIFGEVNPSGKLPATFEKRWEDNACSAAYDNHDNDEHVNYAEGVFLGYRHFDKFNIEPLFPFGFGLSYTTFRYDSLTLSSPKMHEGERLVVGFDVTNIGQREGAEVAQLYIGQLHPREPRPVKELKGFTRVILGPGERRHVEIPLDVRALSYYNGAAKAWVAEKDEFQVLVGGSSRDLPLRKNFAFEGTR